MSREILEYEKTFLQGQVDELLHDRSEQDVMPNPFAPLMMMDPQTIRFSQDSCASTFRCGRLLTETVRDLAEGIIRPELNIPLIEVFLWKGVWFTTGNRRLWAYQQAKMPQAPVKEVEFKGVWQGRLTTKNDGRSIVVRSSASSWLGLRRF